MRALTLSNFNDIISFLKVSFLNFIILSTRLNKHHYQLDSLKIIDSYYIVIYIREVPKTGKFLACNGIIYKAIIHHALLYPNNTSCIVHISLNIKILILKTPL